MLGQVPAVFSGNKKSLCCDVFPSSPNAAYRIRPEDQARINRTLVSQLGGAPSRKARSTLVPAKSLHFHFQNVPRDGSKIHLPRSRLHQGIRETKVQLFRFQFSGLIHIIRSQRSRNKRPCTKEAIAKWQQKIPAIVANSVATR